MFEKPEQTDIAIIGAGPAGVAAAVTAAHAGAQVTLLDESPRAGGQYYKQPALDAKDKQFPPTVAENIRKGRELLSDLQHSNINFQHSTLVWNVLPEERILNLYGPQGAQNLQAKRIIIAAGAYERVIPFTGWTKPGVTTVGGAQLLLKSQGLKIGQRLLLAGTGPLLQLAAVQFMEAGMEVAAILELQSRKEFLLKAPKLWGHWDKLGQGMANQKRLLEAGIPFKFGYTVAEATGDEEVNGAVIMKVNGKGIPVLGSEETIEVDTICLNYGFAPAVELARVAGCTMVFDKYFGSFAIETNENLETSVNAFFVAGETRGIGGVEVALLEGKLAGAIAGSQLGFTPKVDESNLRKEQQQARKAVAALGTMFPLKSGLCKLVKDEVHVCRCEEVTAGEVRRAIEMGVTQLNQLKPWTRVGMGRCQGRICGGILNQMLADETGVSISEIQPFTSRAPIKPVPMESVGGGDDSGEFTWEDHVGYGAART